MTIVIQLKKLAATERKQTATIISLLPEVDYLSMGYSDLVKFCVHELAYSETAARRRVKASELFKKVPSIQKEIEQGH